MAARRRPRARLSKTRFLDGLQCHRLLWWKVYEPDAPELVRSPGDQAVLDRGSRVGEMARGYVPGGVLVDVPHTRPQLRVAETKRALDAGAKTLYEASFFEDGIFVAVDILSRSRGGWTLTEVKSTTKVKEEHLPDTAVQAHVVSQAGLNVKRIELMHLDRACCFPDLSNLFHRADVTAESRELMPDVPAEAKRQLAMLRGSLPEAEPGEHCHAPYECPFLARCWAPAPEHHVSTLYRLGPARAMALEEGGYGTIHDLPDDLELGAVADRQRRAVQSGRVVVEPGLAKALRVLRKPVAYLDFETVALPIPVWPGCHPYDAVPVQMSCHVESKDGAIRHHEWLADGPDDPREPLARALIEAVRGARTIATYSASFERRCIAHLRDNLPQLADALDDVLARIVDLLPIVRNHVYHPDFGGSFSLKAVAPALVGGNGYEGLEVAEGATASFALERLMFDEALPAAERARLRASLLAYCAEDTRALVGLARELRRLA
jgi:predicted RecB family nuclease